MCVWLVPCTISSQDQIDRLLAELLAYPFRQAQEAGGAAGCCCGHRPRPWRHGWLIGLLGCSLVRGGGSEIESSRVECRSMASLVPGGEKIDRKQRSEEREASVARSSVGVSRSSEELA